mgnify:CR=1 FL=1
MQFNSFHFLLFFLVVVTVAILLRRRTTLRNAALLAASYYFYACWDWRLLSLILISTTVDFLCGLAFDSRELDTNRRPRRTLRHKLIFASSLVTNLGLLGFFKYYDFFLDSAVTLLDALGFRADPWSLRIILPVGISFYTFQTLSYTFDLYRGRITTERNPLTFALFVAFFPQLVAGPIERARNLLPQLSRPTVVTRARVYSGMYLILWGLFKKTVLADNVGTFATSVFSHEPASGLFSLLGAYAFTIQIYCDFSAYSDIARGTARCMGIDIMLNFNLPYFSTGPIDFWRRWHISLSTWLRDYLYVPLGGNRGGAARTYFNLMATMTLSGLWHGAGWNFVLWGFFCGLLLVANRASLPTLQRIDIPEQSIRSSLWWLVQALASFHGWVISMVLFRADSVGYAMNMYSDILTNFPGRIPTWVSFNSALALLACGLVLLAVQTAQHRTRDLNFVFRLPTPLRSLYYAAMVLGIIVFGSLGGETFIYFQF